MAGLEIKRLFRGNVLLNGTSYAGTITEAQLPDVSWKLADLKSIAQMGSLKGTNGLDDLKVVLKGSFEAAFLKACANPKKAVQLQIRSSLESIDASGTTGEVPVVAFLTGFAHLAKPGTVKSLDQAAEAEYNIHCNIYKLSADGEVIHDIDLFNNKCVVDGVNVFERGNANIGV